MNFLESVLAEASQEVKDAINELRRGNGWNFRTATEEYLAGLAERTDFERMMAEERGLFARIRRLFNHALEFLGLKNHELSDRELAYITRVRDNILKSKEQKNIQPTKGGHKMVTCQNYVSLFYCQITSCPSDGGIS